MSEQAAMTLPLRCLSTAAAVAVMTADDLAALPLATLFDRPGIAELFEVPAGKLRTIAHNPLIRACLDRGAVVVIAFESDADALLFERQLAQVRGELQ